jgi:hypothetical protein
LLKYPRYFSGGYKYKIMSISVPQAPREVIREYKVRDALFKDWLLKKLETEEGVRVGDMLNGVAEKEKKVSVSQRLNEKLEKMKQDPMVYWDKKKRKPNVAAIMLLQDENRHNSDDLGRMFAQYIQGISRKEKSSVINCNGVEAVDPIN